jgi:exosortase family protein XrtF
MIKKYTPLARFLGLCLIIYVLWSLFSVFVLGENSPVEHWLTKSEAYLVSKLFSAFQYEDVYYVERPPDAHVLYWGSKRLVGISDSCNGLVLFVTFAGFIFAYPARWIHKAIFIPIGITAIFFLNVFRIFCLAIIWIYYPDYLQFNHHYTFTFFVYMDIFLLWLAFVKKFGNLDANLDR